MYYKFTNDYNDLAHEEILKALNSFNCEQNIGYVLDYHSENAKISILEKFNIPNGDCFFLSGGTQTNIVVISYLLKPFEACVACDSGHINVHETGAVEGSGHKIVTTKNSNGKLKALDIENTVLSYNNEHMVKIR